MRYDAGECDAVLCHFADDDEKQIENNIQNTRNHKIYKRALRISVCTEHAVSEIEDSERRHTERIDAEIKHGALDKVILCAEQFQHEPRGNKAEHRYDTACCQTYHKRGAYGSGCARLVSCAEMMRNLNIDSTSHSDEKACEKRNENRCGTDGSQSFRA